MTEVIWTEPAVQDLDAIADFIAVDNLDAARDCGWARRAQQRRHVHVLAGRVADKLREKNMFAGGVVEVREGTGADSVWIDLENGIQIAFSAGGRIEPATTGDPGALRIRHRVADDAGYGWPRRGDTPSPYGIEHHYAPLGFVSWQATNQLRIASCGCQFGPGDLLSVHARI